MINGIQVYEVLEIFAIYSVLGWVCSVMYAALSDRDRKEYKVCKGPYCPSYGFGGIAISAGTYFFGWTPVAGMVAGIVLGTIMELTAIAVVGGAGYKRGVSYRWYHSVVWGGLGAILVYHLNPILLRIMAATPSWFNLIFLLTFWTAMLSNFIDGLWNLSQRKKQNHQTEVE